MSAGPKTHVRIKLRVVGASRVVWALRRIQLLALQEQYLRAIRPRPWPDDDLPSWAEILAGLALMIALAACYWLLPFAVAALREIR